MRPTLRSTTEHRWHIKSIYKGCFFTLNQFAAQRRGVNKCKEAEENCLYQAGKHNIKGIRFLAVIFFYCVKR